MNKKSTLRSVANDYLTHPKSKKGITLVALVVTIVVLLILAAVSINLVLGDNGIVKKAQDAKTKTAEDQENMLTGMNQLADEIDNLAGGNGGGSGTKVPAEETAETAPYFPDNTFTKKEGTIDTGLVIQDADGNEYVWVVVPRTTAVYKTTGLGKTTFTDADYTSIENDLKDYTSAYSKTGYSDTWYDDTENEGWLTETEYNALKNDMLKSIYLNGGFYVGRYEAGIGTNRTSIELKVDGKYPVPTTAPVTKADAYPYTCVTRTQAQNLANNVNSGNKTSSLMFGVQGDLVLAFMSKDTAKITSTDVLTKNSTTIGNYRNSTFDLNRGKYAQHGQLGNPWKNFDSALGSIVVSNETTGKMKKTEQSSYGNGILLTTGGTEQSKVMNIYDIAGNVCEWTLEKYSHPSLAYAFRGGYFDYTGSGTPAAGRTVNSADYCSSDIGFRVSLF